jgi:hypothetical protein
VPVIGAAMHQACPVLRCAQDKDKFAKPDDVVRLYDILIRNTEDLNELAGRLGGRQGEQLITSCTAKVPPPPLLQHGTTCTRGAPESPQAGLVHGRVPTLFVCLPPP